MSIVLTRDVFCDLCSAWTDGVVGGDNKEARRRVLLAGWGRFRDDSGYMVDVCPQCQSPAQKSVTAMKRLAEVERVRAVDAAVSSVSLDKVSVLAANGGHGDL